MNDLEQCGKSNQKCLPECAFARIVFSFDERVVLFLFILLALLWLFREPKVIPGWSLLFEPGYCFKNIILYRFSFFSYVSDGSTAMFVAFLLFVVPSENPFCRKKNGEPYNTLMNWERMKEKFSWSTVLLLGGGYAMASGMRDFLFVLSLTRIEMH